jgi:hypothetical protein
MSVWPTVDPVCGRGPATSAIAAAIDGRPRDIGGFAVRRVLPSAVRRLVGPFIFFDHMGPAEFAHQGLDEHHHCYVNKEGLLDDPRYFFMFEAGHQPLAGMGIILSLTDDGDEAPCRLPLAWVEERVRFMDLVAVRRSARDHG